MSTEKDFEIEDGILRFYVGKDTVVRIPDGVTEVTPEKYAKESDSLFPEWKNSSPSNGINHINNVFVRDGVVDPEQWFHKWKDLFFVKGSI